jgi:hypothetical protein
MVGEKFQFDVIFQDLISHSEHTTMLVTTLSI